MAEELDQANLDPVAVDDLLATLEDNPVRIARAQVLANDADADGDPLSLVGVGEAANGTVALNSERTSITYTPNQNFNGTDSFTYTIGDGQGGESTATVNVRVAPANDAPVVPEPGTVTTDEDERLTFDVRQFVQDPEGDQVTVLAASASRGTVALNEDETVTYTPNTDFNGNDTIAFTVADPSGATAQGTANVTVNPVDDLPVAQDDTATAKEDTPVTVAVLRNDADVDTPRAELAVRLVDQPANGTAVVNPDNTVTFTPDDNFNGTATFSYVVDETTGDGPPPDGEVDPDAPNVATVTVDVTPVNDAPQIAEGQETTTVVTDEDTPLTLNVLALEDDAGNPIITDVDEGDVLTVSRVGSAQNGTVVLNEDGTVTYTPSEDFNGIGGFTYIVSDDNGATVTGDVDVQVNPVNDPPVAADDSAVVDASRQIGTAINVLANDSDPDGTLSPSSVEIVDDPTGGTARVVSGLVVYEPNAGFGGQDQLTYRVADNDGDFSNPATVTIDVRGAQSTQVAALSEEEGLSEEEVLDGDDALFSDDASSGNGDGGTSGDAGSADAAAAPPVDLASLVDGGEQQTTAA